MSLVTFSKLIRKWPLETNTITHLYDTCTLKQKDCKYYMERVDRYITLQLITIDEKKINEILQKKFKTINSILMVNENKDIIRLRMLLWDLNLLEKTQLHSGRYAIGCMLALLNFRMIPSINQIKWQSQFMYKGDTKNSFVVMLSGIKFKCELEEDPTYDIQSGIIHLWQKSTFAFCVCYIESESFGSKFLYVLAKTHPNVTSASSTQVVMKETLDKNKIKQIISHVNRIPNLTYIELSIVDVIKNVTNYNLPFRLLFKLIYVLYGNEQFASYYNDITYLLQRGSFNSLWKLLERMYEYVIKNEKEEEEEEEL